MEFSLPFDMFKIGINYLLKDIIFMISTENKRDRIEQISSMCLEINKII